jgi:hypothetical protein
MKYLGVLVVVFASIACRSYKVDYTTKEIALEGYSNIERKENQVREFKSLPGRIRKIREFSMQAVTSDPSHFLAAKGKVSLLINGAYDKKSKVGFVIQRFILDSNRIENQCMLFKVTNNSVNFNFYSVPDTAYSWKDISPFLKWNKERLFGCGITVLKVGRKKKK